MKRKLMHLSREKESSCSATVALFASISAGMFEEVAKLQQTFMSSAKHANLPCASVEPSSSVLGSRQIASASLKADRSSNVGLASANWLSGSIEKAPVSPNLTS